MPYVMVPVPEEHVEDVMQFILRAIARASIVDWDAESFGRLFEAVDEPSRALLSFTARAVLAGEQLYEDEAVRAIQLTAREIHSIARELNEQAREENHPPLVTRQVLTTTLASGRETQKRVYTMSEEVAALVRDVERAELRAERAERGGEAE
jgi:hypothetical protein